MAVGFLIGAQLGIQALGARQQYRAQKQAFRAQKRANARTTQLLKEDYAANFADSLHQSIQTIQAIRTQLEDEAREGLKQRGTARTVAAEAGVRGNSVNAIMGDLRGQQARSASRHRINAEMATFAGHRERQSMGRQTQLKIASLPTPHKPNATSHLLNFAGQALGAGTQYAMATG